MSDTQPTRLSTSLPDVCLIVEGSYPYVTGGVAAWAHQLIQSQPQLTFHVLSIQPKNAALEKRYDLPSNVVGHTVVQLDHLPEGRGFSRRFARKTAPELQECLQRFSHNADLGDLATLLNLLAGDKEIGSELLLNSKAAFEMVMTMYDRDYEENSFLHFFWSWRALMSGLYSMLLCDLPEAKSYHALSTGFAGILAARAKLETNRPVVLSEHGIYTTERRIEVATAEWLQETVLPALSIEKQRMNLRDWWGNVFANYARICYQAADRIVTLSDANQQAQLADGASDSKLQLIPNGIDVPRYSTIPRMPSGQPTVLFVGRVVSIKDIKTFLRACELLKRQLPEARVLIVGPTDEEPEYYQDCLATRDYLGLAEMVTFTGAADVAAYYAQADVLVLTSLSEAQPLVILEAGACGIPAVATDAGACRDMLLGQPGEDPAFGPGGILTALASPDSTAAAMRRLLTNPELAREYGQNMKQRVQAHYTLAQQQVSYQRLYDEVLNGKATPRAAATPTTQAA